MRLNVWMLLVCLLGTPLFAQDPKIEPADELVPVESAETPLDFWMQKKLGYSSEILKGLALGDFDLVESSARHLRVLNRIEGFVRSRNPDYRTNINLFDRSTNEVIRQAKAENIEGVTLAYHQMTLSCVRCHQTLRE
ncbi:hypothetical protein [Rubripirellula reticaptiva]|uniref:Cytochrome C n=1 Tax=Rubripirellula reticaptiva TaxID=2528013 RepID=A0A5C6EI44_9BACT|nr:hypothetical protein [Rubripirellula reticaptiva]TWU49413.1 hypothetical protein Poly59_40280 [Rubripirellula reticaptiva]